MPLTNGDAVGSTAPLLTTKPVLDYKTALDILDKEYSSRDGLDVHTLLDSRENGALTYNDFLVLPGFIGIDYHGPISATRLT